MKSLRTKILACFLALDIVAVIGIAMMGYNFQIAISSAETLSDTYMEIERDFGDVDAMMQALVKRVFLIQSMDSMGAMADADTAASMIDPGTADKETLQAAIEDLRIQVSEVSDSEFQEEFTALDTAVSGFVDLYGQLEEMYYAGDYAGAMALYFESAHELILGHEENIALMSDRLTTLIDANQQMLDTAANQVKISIVIGVILLVVVSLTALFFVTKAIRPLITASRQLDKILGEMNEGNADLSKRLDNKTSDEVGVLVAGVNNFLATLENIIDKIKNESGNIYTSVENTVGIVNTSRDNVSNVSAIMEELTASMETANNTLLSLNDGAGDVNTAVGQVS
ncbi:MAG: methyl-accepting chemotaxis protein, partial [Lachnospiraceae bacterium]|nr:methyl-accepting chemotaxis protein [Lachnospiraceae bacterium]